MTLDYMASTDVDAPVRSKLAAAAKAAAQAETADSPTPEAAAEVTESDPSETAPAEVAETEVEELEAEPAAPVETSRKAPADEIPTPTAAEDEAPGPFADVPASMRGALEAKGFTELTSVQEAVLADESEGRDLQISSQTGSGKTVALGFALAQRLEAERGGKGPDALIIVPTRELANQVCDELRWLTADLDRVGVTSVTGGTSQVRDRQILAKRPRVLVGTPGRLLDHVTTGALDLSSVSELVLDEADQMLDMGFREDLESILDAMSPERRTHLVSATFPDAIKQLAERYQRNPVSIEGTRLGDANKDISHEGHLVRPRDRYAALVNLLLRAGDERTLVFVSRRADAVEVATRLEADGFAAMPLSGELAQSQRARTLASFRSGRTMVLVATDVAARGLDVPDVGTVIHTEPSFDAQVYTHRSGRTGRAGKRGRSVLLAPPNRRRFVTAQLAQAGVELEWLPVPSAKEVSKLVAKRDREALIADLEKVLTSGRASENLLHAEELLSECEAAPLVAALLTRLQPKRRAEPKDVQSHSVRDEWQRPEGRRQDARPYQKRGNYENRTRREYSDNGGRPSRDARPGRDSYQERGRDRFQGRDQSQGRAPFQGRDQSEGRAPFQGRDQAEGRSQYQGRAPREARDPYQGREQRQGRDQYQGRNPFRGRDDSRGQDSFRGRDQRPNRGPRHNNGMRMERFFVNWGSNQGATPGRLLAALCRRGEVSGADIGSIAIHPNAATFDVAGDVSEKFERLAGRRDPRDPKTMIRRDRGPQGPRS